MNDNETPTLTAEHMMLDRLRHAERDLPRLLMEAEWNSMLIDYAEPVVQRLWTPYEKGKIALQKLLPCDEGKALWHTHPWPCAVHQYAPGGYEMGFAYGRRDSFIPNNLVPPTLCKQQAQGETWYQMTQPATWHYVRPIMAPVYMIMLIGPAWSKEQRVGLEPVAKPENPPGPLDPGDRDLLLKFWKDTFAATSGELL